MKAFYYPYLKQLLVRMPLGTASRMHLFLFVLSLILVKQTVRAQFGSDLGSAAISTLAWKDIRSLGLQKGNSSIGLTTDNRMYLWGDNFGYPIVAQIAAAAGGQSARNTYVPAPYYKPSPDGPVQKVRIYGSRFGQPTFMCLTQSGKLYGWGINGTSGWGDGSTGLLGTVGAAGSPAWPLLTTSATATDTTLALRTPKRLNVANEANVVDFDVNNDYCVAIGSSGRAYYLDGFNVTTFSAIPKPAVADTASFKYTNVWLPERSSDAGRLIYLKGNDNKIYYTGVMTTASNNYYLIKSNGIPSMYGYPAAGLTTDELNGNVLKITPRNVPFPAGENIVSIRCSFSNFTGNIFAISASGKAFATGGWKSVGYNTSYLTYYSFPLKNTPQVGTELQKEYINNLAIPSVDSVYILKGFVELATVPGASKTLDVFSLGGNSRQVANTLIVGDNNRVYWSGNNSAGNNATPVLGGNLLSFDENGAVAEQCWSINYTKSLNPSSWYLESINFKGAARFTPVLYSGLPYIITMGIISKNGRGYFLGEQLDAFAGIGKIVKAGSQLAQLYMPFPIPIANELQLSCNTSPGTGGPLGDPVSTPAAGVIDCSKTQLYPAPVQGTPSQLSLLVTVNVTTAGDFSPLSVSGSGITLVSGFEKVTAASTGIQTFHIPIKYDGSTLTNAFQFTIGQAGSCSADLTKTPTKAITDIWTLECVPSVGPMLKK